MKSLGKTLFLTLLVSVPAHSARIKDIAQLRGMRDNQLTGYGLVVGLAATGDKDLELTANSLKQVLKGMGITEKEKLPTKNAAAVLVTANLKPFARAGARFDIQVSSIGTAASLEGGTLMMTALRGPDGQVYAMAQGQVQVPKSGDKRGGSAKAVTGAIPNGAILEKELRYNWKDLKELEYQLREPDFTTAARIAYRINQELSGRFAIPNDAGSVKLIVPYGYEGTTIDLIAQVESIEVEADQRSKVIVDSKTGTVILGENVQILPVAIAHGDLSVEVVSDTPNAAVAPVDPAVASADGAEQAQPEPPARKKEKVMMLQRGTNIKVLVDGLNAMGAGADELVAILQGLRASGSLLAELEIR